MEVGQVVPPDEGDRPGGLGPRVRESRAVQVRPLEDPDARQPGDPGAVAPRPGAEQHRNPLAVVGGELLDDPVGQGVVPAHDQVIPVLGQTAGHRGHGEI